MAVLYGAIPAVIFFFQGIGFKLYSIFRKGKPYNEYLFNFTSFALCVAIAAPFAFIGQAFDARCAIYGAIEGLFICGMVVFYGKAMSCGKIAFNNFVLTLSMLIPIFGGMFLGEKIKLLQWIGLAVFAFSAYLVCFGQKSSDSPAPKKAYVYIFISAAFLGLLSFAIKYFNARYTAETDGGAMNQCQFLFFAFVAATAVTLLLFSVTAKKYGVKEYFSDWHFYLCVAMVALATAFGEIIFSIFSLKADGVLFYPVENGLQLALGALFSPLFKEKLSAMTLIGIAVGVVAVVLLNL